MKSVQGGLITPNNHLLIVCDTPPGEAVSGFHLFDLLSGRRRWHYGFHFDYGYSPKFRQEELEGFTIRDLGDGGYLHLLVLGKERIGRDDASIMHFDTWPVTDRWKL